MSGEFIGRHNQPLYNVSPHVAEGDQSADLLRHPTTTEVLLEYGQPLRFGVRVQIQGDER